MEIGKGSSANLHDVAKSDVRDTASVRAPANESAAARTSGESPDVVKFGEGRDLLRRAFELSAAKREGQVEAVRSKLAEGSYSVSSLDVSEAIVRDMLAGAVAPTAGE